MRFLSHFCLKAASTGILACHTLPTAQPVCFGFELSLTCVIQSLRAFYQATPKAIGKEAGKMPRRFQGGSQWTLLSNYTADFREEWGGALDTGSELKSLWI